MRQLVLRNNTYEMIYRSIGVVWFVMLLVVLLTGDRQTWSLWLQVIVLLMLAILFISLNFGTLINKLTAERGRLTIRWYTRPGKITLDISDIETIHGDENYVRIVLKSGRTVRLPTSMLEFSEKHALRKFLKEVTGF